MDANDFAQYQNLIQNSVNANNAWSAEQAQKQMDFQERMSNTAHQREIEDLKKAGLNPILSAGGNGASTPAGSIADPDRGGTTALLGLLEKLIDSQTAQANANFSLSQAAAPHILEAVSTSASGIQAPNEKAKVQTLFETSAKKVQKGADRTGKETVIIPVNSAKQPEVLLSEPSDEIKKYLDKRNSYGDAVADVAATLAGSILPKVNLPLVNAFKRAVTKIAEVHKYDRRGSIMGVPVDTTKLPVNVRNKYWLR